MSLRGVRGALKKVPPLFHAARAVQSAGRALLGPAWLKRRVERQVADGGPLRIVIGSSQVFDPGWIPTNVQYLNLLVDDQWRHAFGKHRLDAILAEHVWEHLTPADGRAAAAQCLKYLKPGGYLRIAVPDGNHPDPNYIEFVRPGGTGPGARDHKTLYTSQTISDMLQGLGFRVELLEYYDPTGSFHASTWNPQRGTVIRRNGWSEKSPNGSVIPFSSLIVDAHKPLAHG